MGQVPDSGQRDEEAKNEERDLESSDEDSSPDKSEASDRRKITDENGDPDESKLEPVETSARLTEYLQERDERLYTGIVRLVERIGFEDHAPERTVSKVKCQSETGE